MIKYHEQSKEIKFKGIICMLSLFISICLLHIHADASTITSFRSSDSNESYYTLSLDQNKIQVDGRTTEYVSVFNAYLLSIKSKVEYETSFCGSVVNNNYHETWELPSSNGQLVDGTYLLMIQLNDAQGDPFIIVNHGKASFYQSDYYNTEILGDAYMNSINPDELLKSDTNYYQDCTQSESDELHQLSIDITKGIQSDYEKSKAIYRWVTENIYYGKANDNSTFNIDYNNPYIVYKLRYGVCEGYARLLAEMLRSIQIPAAVIYGKAYDTPTSPAGSHVWVAIHADERWFYADPTWDSHNKYQNENFIKGTSALNYFDTGILAMAEDHHMQFIMASTNLNDFNVMFFNENISVTAYNGTNSKILLPAKLNDLPITQAIGTTNAKTNMSVETIIVPEGYKKLLGAFAAYPCLGYISLPDSIDEIDDYAFPYDYYSITFYCRNNKLITDLCNKRDIYLDNNIPDYMDYKNYNSTGTFINFNNVITDMPGKFTYTGSLAEPKPSVTYNGKKLILGKDYVLSYYNNDVPGKSAVEIHGIGNFIGDQEIEFVIVPQTVPVHLSSIKSKTVQVKWNKSAYAEGYDVYYSTTKNGKYKKLKDTTSLKITIDKLTSGKTYYFKVRPYIFIYDIKECGAFSKVEEIKVS